MSIKKICKLQVGDVFRYHVLFGDDLTLQLIAKVWTSPFEIECLVGVLSPASYDGGNYVRGMSFRETNWRTKITLLQTHPDSAMDYIGTRELHLKIDIPKPVDIPTPTELQWVDIREELGI